MNIAGREIGGNSPPFVVCEVSGEHKGDMALAIKLIDAAKAAGADAVKLQLYDPDSLAQSRAGLDLDGTPWTGRQLADLYTEARTPSEWFPALFAHARRVGITIFSSVFDEYGVDYLEDGDCPAYKISSYEAADVALVSKAASTGKPLIMSTGRVTEKELGRSVAEAAKRTNQIALLYCVSQYPAPIESIDFDQIGVLRHRFGLPVGFSDHTVGIEAAIKAVEHGACIIEKHLTLRRSDGGPDAAFSLEPHELEELVQRVKNAH